MTDWDEWPKAPIAEPIFVFGANLVGRHGKGAALYAKNNCGAIQGQGYGRQGNSFGIPTKDGRLHTLSLSSIEKHVMGFITYATDNPDLQFKLTPIGCGLAGYSPEDIAPMFVSAPSNVILPPEFVAVLGKNK
jgi:hypothetical protein